MSKSKFCFRLAREAYEGHPWDCMKNRERNVPLMAGRWLKKRMLLFMKVRCPAMIADILTVMAILSGLVSKKLPQLLVSKRRDIMIESAAYDIIKEEGLREGREEGLKQGLQEGILEILEIRFNVVPSFIITKWMKTFKV
jgi:hypothetical protein